MILRHAHDSFFVQGALAGDAPRLIDLGWRRHPAAPDAWWTRSPYLAAPLWGLRDPADAMLARALGWCAWNYETSFAKAPLVGTGIDAIRLPAGERLYDFQVAGVQRGLLREKMIIADQPGAGKTCQALAVLNHARPNRTLIACPTFLVDNWAMECERWCVDAQPIAILNGAKKTIPEKGIVILPYSRAHTFEKQLAASPPVDLLVCDEFHATKDQLARRSWPFVSRGGLIERSRRALLLSGTPMPNNPVEIYGALRATAPELIGAMSKDAFQATYCQTIDLKVDVATKSGTRKVEVQKIVGKSKEALNAELRASGVMIRRLKSDVLEQLPAKNSYFVHMHPSAEVETLVKEENDLFDQLQMRIMTSQELIALKGHIASVRRRLGVLKAPSIAAYAKSIFDAGEDRVVLFMLHLEAIEKVRQEFEGGGVTVHVLTGAESPSERFNRVRDFQSPGGRKLVVGQVTAAGEGLTMTASRYAILGEISWTPGKNEQAVDRCHRVSQTRQVDCPVMTFPHAVEEKVIRVNARKALDARAVLDDNLQRMFMEAAE